MKARRRSDQFFQQTNVPERRVSRGTVALLGGLCAVAVLLSGVVIAGFVAPDQLRTAAISAAEPENENPVSAAVAASAPRVAPKPASVQTASISTAKVDRAVPPVVQAAARGQAPAVVPLPAGDTRWAKPAAPKQEAEVAIAPAAEQPRKAVGPDERGTVAPQATASEMLADNKAGMTPDDAATASIPAAGSTDDVQVAESEAEVAKLEAATGMVNGQAEAGQPTTDIADKPLPAMKTARVTKYVNLRAGPADESRVIAVVPANAEVKVESGCQWCTAVYNGQRGYIYKSFIRRSLKEAAAEGTGLF